ncbi:sulfotransferase [Sorangium sp. So ce1128]
MVLIGSSSRGGSSLLAEILRHSAKFVHLRAEINPFLALNAHVFPTSGTDSDALEGGASTAELDSVGADLALDWGERTDFIESEVGIWRFAVDLTCRLSLQWPEHNLELEPDRIASCIHDCLRTLQHTCGWRVGRFEDAATFHALFLNRARQIYPWIIPHHYDIDRRLIDRFGPAPMPAPGPPGDVLIEEPPFVIIQPWRLADEASLESRALVIKTPSNAYRLPYFRALFPNATVQIVHLVRNPAAAINGLYDGWLHNGFFSHRLPFDLQIEGYSDVFPGWGRAWWKFDLPPGWREWTARRLEEVCAFQWISAHQALIQHLDTYPPESGFRLRFEDLVGPPASRLQALDRLLRWLGVAPESALTDLVARPLPVVMATQQPTRGRWRRRANLIAPLLEREPLRSLAARLGYGSDAAGWD